MKTLEREVAHFVWHGTLSLYEIKCIESFVKNNFEVNLWSYDKLENVPNGATLRDIREFLPEEHKFKYKQKHPFGLEQDSNKQYANLAMFSDAFRIMVLKQFG